ncbi:MAG: hypothetical protein AAGJ87_00605 [Pseudomonadota bacterium]
MQTIMLEKRRFSAKPITASMLVAGLVAAGAAGAVAAVGAGQNALRDVQVGERGRLMRIALVCEKSCQVNQRDDGGFMIAGVQSDLEIPLAGRSRQARALTFQPGANGSIMTVLAEQPIVSASTSDCSVRGGAASCVDLTFAEVVAETASPPSGPVATAPTAVAKIAGESGVDRAAERTAPAIAQARVTAPAIKPATTAPSTSTWQSAPAVALKSARETAKPLEVAAPPSIASPSTASPSTPRRAVQTAPAKPTLRAAPRENVLSFDTLREATPTLATLRAAAAPTTSVAAPSLRSGDAAPIDLRQRTQVLLGRSYDAASCRQAQDRLNDDAWALDAMVDVGFCKALSGDLAQADALFARLLDYAPDRYDALLGRAMIAERAGEKGVARKYYRDALNASPPAESAERIAQSISDL